MRGGSVLIPAFAVDRIELVLHALSQMTAAGDIPALPLYVDSPMALAALDVYRSPAMRVELRPDLPARLVDLPHLHTAHSAQESMLLNEPQTPSIIISASGMATGGRVVHHLQHLLPDRRNTVILTGYQAVGTRGRLLAEGATELKMYGGYVPVRAEVGPWPPCFGARRVGALSSRTSARRSGSAERPVTRAKRQKSAEFLACRGLTARHGCDGRPSLRSHQRCRRDPFAR